VDSSSAEFDMNIGNSSPWEEIEEADSNNWNIISVCSKCSAIGHLAFNCPSRSALMTSVLGEYHFYLQQNFEHIGTLVGEPVRGASSDFVPPVLQISRQEKLEKFQKLFDKMSELSGFLLAAIGADLPRIQDFIKNLQEKNCVGVFERENYPDLLVVPLTMIPSVRLSKSLQQSTEADKKLFAFYDVLTPR